MVSLRQIALILLLSCASLAAQEAFGPPEPPSDTTTGASPEEVRGIHVYGDGINYYDVERVPAPTTPLLPSAGSLYPAPYDFQIRQEELANEAAERRASQEAYERQSSLRLYQEANDHIQRLDAERAKTLPNPQADALAAIDSLKAELEQVALFTQHVSSTYARGLENVRKEHVRSREKSITKLSEAAENQIKDALAKLESIEETYDVPEEKMAQAEASAVIRRFYADRLEERYGTGARSLVGLSSPLNLVLGDFRLLVADSAKTASGQISDELFDAAAALGDVAAGFTPVLGWVKDLFESCTGLSALTGRELSSYERGFAAAGVLTAGVLTVGKTAIQTIGNLSSLAPTAAKSTGQLTEVLKHADEFVAPPDAIKFTPINPGPLHQIPVGSPAAIDSRILHTTPTIADTFRSSSYFQRTLPSEKILVRQASSESALMRGSYFSDAPSGKLQTEIDQAILPDFKNDLSHTGYFKVPKGITIYEGVTAPQLGITTGVRRMGGGKQTYIVTRPGDLQNWRLPDSEVESLREAGVIP